VRAGPGKDAIRRRGENISSYELEAVTGSHPGVREVAAIAVPSPVGEDDVMVVVAPVDGAELDPEDLLRYLLPRLPHYMVPRYVRTVAALPKTPTAKVQKHLLRSDGVTAGTYDREQHDFIVAGHADFARRFGVRLRTCFTSTEICVPLVTDPSGRIDDPASCGRVRTDWPGIEVRLVDEHDIAVPPGEMGELIVRTAVPWTMNAGYLDRPDATAAAWRNGWFHTGDCLRQAGPGDFYFHDRVKDALRRRGENISSFEVESFIRRHPAVKDVAVIGVPSELGEDEVFAIIETAGGSPVTPAELMEFLRPIMPRFMLPRFVELVAGLPRTEATLRVRKAELRARGRSPATWARRRPGKAVRPGRGRLRGR
jgi:acyl-CoA synthetase (AMP-forming)/AMP-acid ligase II